MDDKQFLLDIASENPDTRFAAWRAAGGASPAVIPQLGKLAAGSNPGVARAGREALTTMTHAVGKDPAAPRRAAVVHGLLELAGGGDLGVRAHALRLLSDIAGEDSVPAIARLFSVPELREEVVFSLERIPGEASNRALLAAYRSVPEDFKPRVLAALGHRRVPEAVPVCTEALASSNVDLSVAAVRALGRIGAKSSVGAAKPDTAKLSAWQTVDWMDSQLRYADARRADGDNAEAMRVYRMALERPEEHWQCAGIIGIAKMENAEAAAAILPKMKSENSRVRITAQKAWKSMAGSKAG